MVAQLALLVAMQLSSAVPPPYERITPQIAAERITQCGAGSVTIKPDPELDADILVVAAAGPITDEQIACIANAASFYDVKLPPDAQPRLDATTKARGKALAEAHSRQWLADKNLLGRLPKYEAGVTNDAAFARKIEKLCNAKGAFHSRYGVHALNPDWARRQKDLPFEDQQFACVLNASLASGFELNFIGNEQATP